MNACMDCSYHYIVASAQVRNGIGHRTAIMAVPLLLTSGPVRYEAVLHNVLLLCVCMGRDRGRSGMNQKM